MRRFLAVVGLVYWVTAVAPPVFSEQEQQQYTFDLSEIEKKPYTLGGFFELEPIVFVQDRNAAFYKLRSWDEDRSRVQGQADLGGRLEGSYEKGVFSAFARTEALLRYDSTGWDGLDVGKLVTKWGTGYVRNPVAFVDRPKNPDDPQEPLEGFYAMKIDLNKSFQGALKSVAFTPVLVPVTEDVNKSFGEPSHLNFAAKLYLLLWDTDLDLVFFTGGSKTTRYGLDFARNLKSNLEVHGELAWLSDQRSFIQDGQLDSALETSDVLSGLLGIRYLTPNLITLIVEYYHNGAGIPQDVFQSFLQTVRDAYEAFLNGDPTLLREANQTSQEAFATANPLQDYLYVRASQKDAFGIVYFTPALTSMVNLRDGSFQLFPEIQYSFSTNLVLRGRTIFLVGGRDTEFGEKRNDFRFELRLRYFF
jgi:hypothetical protein